MNSRTVEYWTVEQEILTRNPSVVLIRLIGYPEHSPPILTKTHGPFRIDEYECTQSIPGIKSSNVNESERNGSIVGERSCLNDGFRWTICEPLVGRDPYPACNSWDERWERSRNIESSLVVFSVQTLSLDWGAEMEGASSLFAAQYVSIWLNPFQIVTTVQSRIEQLRGSRGKTYDLARIFLRLRLRRRTRFFLHLALIFVDVYYRWVSTEVSGFGS